MDSLRAVHELADEDHDLQLANDYADSIECCNSTLVIAPTHAERAVVNDAIRDEVAMTHPLRRTKHRHAKTQTPNRGSTSRHVNSPTDDVVEFVTRGKDGFKAGDRLKVVKVEERRILAYFPPLREKDLFNVVFRRLLPLRRYDRAQTGDSSLLASKQITACIHG